MSAVILEFPRNPRAISETRRTVKHAISQIATLRHATSDERTRALGAAFNALARGRPVTDAIAAGYDALPRPSFRPRPYPTDPRPAA